MISKISRIITAKLCKLEVIQNNDFDLYEYGFFVLITNFLFLLVSISCGIIFRILFESIVFYILFSVLRMYAGGVHASSERTCMVCTTFSIIICNLIIKIFTYYHLILVPSLILCASTLLIAFLCPLDSESKPLTDEDKKHFKKVSLLILIAIVVLSFVTITFDKMTVFYSCNLSLLLESILLVIGKIKQKLIKFEKSKF